MTTTKHNVDDWDVQKIKVTTFNAQGLRNNKKLKALIRTIKQEQIDISLLQETYLSNEDLPYLSKLWSGTIHLSRGTNRSKGLLTLFSNKISEHNIQLIHKDERTIISRLQTKNNEYLDIVNVYGPCNSNEKISFFTTLTNKLKSITDENYISSFICGGDMNIVKHNELDIISGNKHDLNTVEKLNQFVNELNLGDVWRIFHPDKKRHTWRRGQLARRLDYIFTEENLLNFVEHTDIKNKGFSDHSCCSITLSFSKFKRGPSYYKMNTELFKDIKYVNLIKKQIPIILNKHVNLNKQQRWEMLKIEISEISQQYSRHKSSVCRSQSIIDRKVLNNLEEELTTKPNDTNLIKRIDTIKNRVEAKIMEETRSAQIRAGIKWREQGEKTTKFFLSLEKSRARDNTITNIRSNGKTIYDEKIILHEIGKFYQELYTENSNKNEKNDQADKYIEDLSIPKISKKDQDDCDKTLSENDIAKAIKSMKNGSSPGSDGLLVEFYKIFWNDLKQALLDCYSYSFLTNQLTFSQRKGIISLLHKGKGLEKNELSNWRPITLTNVDYKILAKALAMRLQEQLKSIISDDQKGFIKGRNISDVIRQIDDIIEHEKCLDSSSILFVIDYTKAFDTVSKTFLIKCFELFGFGPYFRKWIDILLSNRTFCAKNGGYISKEYDMERGVRQGCPISPYMFLLVAEMLSLKVNQCDKIKGIKIFDNYPPHKLKQFADDTAFLLKDLIDFREILSKIKLFSEISGLHINMKKSYAMSLGKKQMVGEEHFGIQFVDTIKILGVHFSQYCSASENPANWESKIEKLEKIFGLWAKRDLSIKGKIIIVKTFGLSQFIYLMQSIGLPDKIITKINRIFFSFIWKRKYSSKKAFEKVKRKVMYNNFESGGLNMINIELMQKSFLADWARKLLIPSEESWKLAPLKSLQCVGGIKIFDSIINKNEIIGIEKISNTFWKKVVCVWCDNNNYEEIRKRTLNMSDPIFNNNKIKYKGKVLFLYESIKRGIYYIKDIHEKGNIITFRDFIKKYGDHPRAFLDYKLIIDSLKNKYIDSNNDIEANKLFCQIPIEKMKRKDIYNKLKEEEYPHKVTNFWAKKQITLEEKHWTLPTLCTKETRLQTLQWKILHNIFPTAILLHKMGIVNSIKCKKCNLTEFSEHFFFDCNSNKQLWEEVTSIINSKFGLCIDLNLQTVMTGYFNKKLNKRNILEINHVLLIAKMIISKSKYGKGRNMVTLLHEELNNRNIKT